jgi:hypothetical protein
MLLGDSIMWYLWSVGRKWAGGTVVKMIFSKLSSAVQLILKTSQGGYCGGISPKRINSITSIKRRPESPSVFPVASLKLGRIESADFGTKYALFEGFVIGDRGLRCNLAHCARYSDLSERSPLTRRMSCFIIPMVLKSS